MGSTWETLSLLCIVLLIDKISVNNIYKSRVVWNRVWERVSVAAEQKIIYSFPEILRVG